MWQSHAVTALPAQSLTLLAWQLASPGAQAPDVPPPAPPVTVPSEAEPSSDMAVSRMSMAMLSHCGGGRGCVWGGQTAKREVAAGGEGAGAIRHAQVRTDGSGAAASGQGPTSTRAALPPAPPAGMSSRWQRRSWARCAAAGQRERGAGCWPAAPAAAEPAAALLQQQHPIQEICCQAHTCSSSPGVAEHWKALGMANGSSCKWHHRFRSQQAGATHLAPHQGRGG